MPRFFRVLFFRASSPEKQNSKKSEAEVWGLLPRAAVRLRYAPAGLALGYYLAAPSGRRSLAEFSLLEGRAEGEWFGPVRRVGGRPRRRADSRFCRGRREENRCCFKKVGLLTSAPAFWGES